MTITFLRTICVMHTWFSYANPQNTKQHSVLQIEIGEEGDNKIEKKKEMETRNRRKRS